MKMCLYLFYLQEANYATTRTCNNREVKHMYNAYNKHISNINTFCNILHNHIILTCVRLARDVHVCGTYYQKFPINMNLNLSILFTTDGLNGIYKLYWHIACCCTC